MTSFDSGSFVMKLFIATPSPFARKARVTLLEKQIPHEIIVDNPWQPGSQVKGINPLAKIPTLVLDDGRVIHDSKVIFEYLELERQGICHRIITKKSSTDSLRL